MLQRAAILGRQQTYATLPAAVYWMGVYDVRDYVNSCVSCTENKVTAGSQWLS